MSKEPQTTILQREITLDDALLSMRTFRNGCDFKIISKADGSHWLTYGCYGVHVNLTQGANRLLMHWLDGDAGLGKGTERKIEGVSPETIVELLNRKPCKECGGFVFEKRAA